MHLFKRQVCAHFSCLSFVVAGFLLPVDSVFAAEFGPLKTYAQSPLQSNSLTPELRSGFTKVAGQSEFYLTGTVASVWAHSSDISADYYQNALVLGVGHQLSSRWYVEGRYNWHFAADNHLDGLTRGFHDLFGIGQNGRDEVPNHSFDLSVPKYGIELHDFEGETLNQALTLYLQYQLLETQQHGLSLGGSLYYHNVNSGPFADEGFEQALQLNYSYRAGAHRAYSTVGITFRSEKEGLGDMPYRENAATVAAGYEYQINGNHALLVEYHWYAGAAKEEIEDLSDASNEVLLGYRYQWHRHALEVSMIENLINMDNSTDIAFTVGYRHQF
ncbi:hypothetical protein VST7929_01554 [Vibrio stylophorae]|uniref:DUF3187 family protein n=1 Tax=Vibrio stylophorae TaxID=659351 RepID=A0ABM8ZUP5_9VIBR|nr:DUF3187 family protein [Vibrio stylophorae]CAH0533683.1 hypothetical protein VST7929_01554 [Vibrio stylophorae]